MTRATSSIHRNLASAGPPLCTPAARRWRSMVKCAFPIFGPEQGITGLHSLEFDAGGRFEDWRNNDTNALVPKVTMRWQPIDEQLTIRSTWGEGVIAPPLTELYGALIFGGGAAHFRGLSPAVIF